MRRVDKGQSRGEERRLPAAGDGDRPRDDPAWEAAANPFYNFGRIHQTIRVSPAMQAGLSDHVLEP